MTLNELQAVKAKAMKEKNAVLRDVMSSMIDSIQKASITPKGRIEITEQLVDEVLIKYQKTIQEMIDTCPANRTDLMEKYTAEMAIVKMYAPQLLTDENEIRALVLDALNNEYALEKKNRGQIMKIVTPVLKGRADMKIASQVIAEMLK